MNKFMKTFGLFVFIASIVCLVLPLISSDFEFLSDFFLLGIVLYWFTVGYRHYFEEDEKIWGLIFMVTSGFALVIAIVANLPYLF